MSSTRIDSAAVRIESAQNAGVARPFRRLAAFGLFALAFLIGSEITGFVISPPDRDMGNLQKIMYVHVPAAWVMLLCYAGVFIASALYLWKRNERFDLIAASAAEVGVVLNALTLGLGSIWGRPTWGVWWTWDPRLTSTAVMLLIYIGYLSLRSFIEDDERRARWSATVGILGFVNAYIVYESVMWWRSLHQPFSSPSTVDPVYVLGLRLNAFAFLFVAIFFVAVRYRIAALERTREARLEDAALNEGATRA